MPEYSIFEKVSICADNFSGQELPAAELVKWIILEFPGTNASNIILSDYCYNIINHSLRPEKYRFEYIQKNGQDFYKCLGKKYPYTGKAVWKEKGVKLSQLKTVGEWTDGKFQLAKECTGLFKV
ncbi:MAG TPA: hypothetical protein PKI19_01505 [Elusimicrobiales bacterium]|nr:hypothetical protein [Elusimicrobiales bacterium]